MLLVLEATLLLTDRIIKVSRPWLFCNAKKPKNQKPMITSLLVDSDPVFLDSLEKQLKRFCPYIQVRGKLKNLQQASACLINDSPDLLFLSPEERESSTIPGCETIYVTSSPSIHQISDLNNVAGILSKPLNEIDLISVVAKAQENIYRRKSLHHSKDLIKNLLRIHSRNDRVAIPTMEGYEFFAVDEIVCCEGLQKCTRVITTEQTDIVSAYNIGEFKKLLEPFGFFAPHKSFLINLSKIKSYHKEGVIKLISGHQVPLARRRKEQFLQQIRTI